MMVYCGLLFIEHEFTVLTSSSGKDYSTHLSITDVAKNIVLVFLSVFSSSLVSAYLFEKKNLNNDYFENINEVFANTKFYKGISTVQKKQLLKKLEEELYPKRTDKKGEIIDALRGKILDADNKFYYESCDTVVTCKIKDHHIEKNITREMKICSYNERKTIENFKFASSTLENMIDCKPFVIHEIELNGKCLKKGRDYLVNQKDVNNETYKKSGYDISYSCISKNPIVLSQECTRIKVKYTTVVSLTDTVFTSRLQEHCKNYSLNFKIDSHDEYKLYCDAYGFLDDGSGVLNDSSPNNISVKFNGWVFKKDGVSISFHKK